MTQLHVNSNKAMKYGFQVIYALGGGVLFPGRLCAVQASQQDSDVPMATALISFCTSLGQAFGVGIGGVIFQNHWTAQLASAMQSHSFSPNEIITYREAEQTSQLIKNFPVEIQEIYRAIMANVIDTLFIVLATLSGVAFLVSLTSRNLSMDRETRSSQRFKEKRKTGNQSTS